VGVVVVAVMVAAQAAIEAVDVDVAAVMVAAAEKMMAMS
jgi:hypothetical protein